MKKIFLLCFIAIFFLSFNKPAFATIYEHSFKLTDIKVSENSNYYNVSILFLHDYLSQPPFNDDNWEIMLAWAWGPYADLQNLLGYDSASAYLTQTCMAHPINIDQARNFCSLIDATTTNARLSPIHNDGCPIGYPNCCFGDSLPHSYSLSAGGYVLMDEILSNKFTNANSGDILLEIRFKKSDTNWNEFKSKVLDGIYIIMDWNTPGGNNDDKADFIWSPDTDHVDHDWYFKRMTNKVGGLMGCMPYGNEDKGSSLARLVDSMEDDTGFATGICDDWKFMGSSHEEFYGGVSNAFDLRGMIGEYNTSCDPHIAKPYPDGGGSSTCIDLDCESKNIAGVAWASEEKKLGRDVGMQCDNDNDYYQCYSGHCDLTDYTCIKCNGAIQSEGKTGVSKCEENCGASHQCDEKSSGSWCEGNIKKSCNSNCQYSEVNCKNYGSSYYCSGGRCTSPPRGGCPTLFVYDGKEYVKERKSNIHSQPGIDTVDDIALTTKPIAIDGNYLLSLKETTLPEHSYIDSVRLFVTDSEGRKEAKLVSAKHSKYGDVINAIAKSDDIRTDTQVFDNIELKFKVPELKGEAKFTFEIEGYNPAVNILDKGVSIIGQVIMSGNMITKFDIADFTVIAVVVALIAIILIFGFFKFFAKTKKKSRIR